jgi:hypothetical protein
MQWKVTVMGAGPVPFTLQHVVEADYLTHANGSLVFKKTVANGYPQVVAVFAPGRWLEVTR